MQQYLDNMQAAWKRERANTQMTLGSLISKLEALEKNPLIVNLVNPCSYRGYYSDLAFDTDGIIGSDELLELLKTTCLAQTFTGYKGGDFTMDENTPIWIADYGNLGVKIIDLAPGDIITFIIKEDED